MPMRYRRAMYAGALALAAMAISRAAQFRFQEKEQAFRLLNKDQLQKLGITRAQPRPSIPLRKFTWFLAAASLPERPSKSW